MCFPNKLTLCIHLISVSWIYFCWFRKYEWLLHIYYSCCRSLSYHSDFTWNNPELLKLLNIISMTYDLLSDRHYIYLNVSDENDIVRTLNIMTLLTQLNFPHYLITEKETRFFFFFSIPTREGFNVIIQMLLFKWTNKSFSQYITLCGRWITQHFFGQIALLLYS